MILPVISPSFTCRLGGFGQFGQLSGLNSIKRFTIRASHQVAKLGSVLVQVKVRGSHTVIHVAIHDLPIGLRHHPGCGGSIKPEVIEVQGDMARFKGLEHTLVGLAMLPLPVAHDEDEADEEEE